MILYLKCQKNELVGAQTYLDQIECLDPQEQTYMQIEYEKMTPAAWSPINISHLRQLKLLVIHQKGDKKKEPVLLPETFTVTASANCGLLSLQNFQNTFDLHNLLITFSKMNVKTCHVDIGKLVVGLPNDKQELRKEVLVKHKNEARQFVL